MHSSAQIEFPRFTTAWDFFFLTTDNQKWTIAVVFWDSLYSVFWYVIGHNHSQWVIFLNMYVDLNPLSVKCVFRMPFTPVF